MILEPQAWQDNVETKLALDIILCLSDTSVEFNPKQFLPLPSGQ